MQYRSEESGHVATDLRLLQGVHTHEKLER
jgi:hypothetical protein